MSEAPPVKIEATVRWFDEKKGFGFASPTEGGDDIFVHQQNIVSDVKNAVLNEDDKIYYELGEYKGRPTALNVTLPVGHEPAKRRNRPHSRRAKKEADAEAEDIGKAEEAAAVASVSGLSLSDPAVADPEPEQREGGGRDGKTHRAAGSATRSRRNDKGVGGAKRTNTSRRGGGEGASEAAKDAAPAE